MAQGKCVVCSVSNQTGRDFICGQCGDPNGVTMYCVHCDKRTALKDAALETVERQMGRELPRRHGVVLRLTSCADCGTEGETVQTKIFLLKKG